MRHLGHRLLTGSTAAAFSMAMAVVPLAGASQAVESDPPGDAWGWGENYEGQLGDGTPLNEVGRPVKVAGVSEVTAVSAGGNHTLELLADATVWAHGSNAYGQLGDGTTTWRDAPVQVSGLTDVVAVSGGNAHSLALLDDGTVWSWGLNDYGQLGDNTTVDQLTPVKVKKLKNAIAVSAGADHNLALKANGTVVAWGNNSSGELGDGTTVDHLLPTKVPGLHDVTAIAASGRYDVDSRLPWLSSSFALRSSGAVWAWGSNADGLLGDGGVLGDGTKIDRHVPTRVPGLSKVDGFSAGWHHTLAVRSDGTVWAWGDNYYGQLGDGTQGDSLTPQQVPGITDATAVSAGFGHSIALRADGTALGWGDNFYGSTGIGDLRVQKVLTPTAVEGLTGITSIDAGRYHSLAVAAASD